MRNNMLLSVASIAVLAMSVTTRGFFSSVLSRLLGKNALIMEEARSASSAASASSLHNLPMLTDSTAQNEAIHLVFLVHGFMGNPSELKYLQKALERHAEKAVTARSKEEGSEDQNKKPLFLIHSAVCNDGRTYDGIAAGGSRLASEVNAIVQKVLEKTTAAGEEESESSSAETTSSPTKVSLSFIGNSLGGLYARYALSEIDWEHLHPAVFCTTATPHLGVISPHNYARIPLRWAEYGVAQVLRQTGLDLFRFSTVIQDMTILDKFTKPLAQFHHRIAYANAHNTDFQVPCSTAAFLSQTGDSRHNRVADDDVPAVSSPLLNASSEEVTLIVTTERREEPVPVSPSDDEQISSDELAVALDNLGWTKIFCDVRQHLPGISIPFQSSSPSEELANDDGSTTASTVDGVRDEYQSSELWDKFANFLSSDKLHAPFGHTLLVANSKNDFYAKSNAAGQPVMDELAANLVQEILQQQEQQHATCE